MTSPCPTCIPLDCVLTDDPSLYTLQGELFPFVLNCPPGFDCSGAGTLQVVCCGQLISVAFPAGATVDEKQVLIAQALNDCYVRNLYCGQNTPNTPTQLYYNQPKQCTVFCPDGSPFVYTVPAGTFVASSQADADANASNYACQQAALRKVCLGSVPGCTCNGSVFSTSITAVGGISPLIWSVVSGTLPPGLSLSQTGVLSGTPTTNGQYTFTIQVTEPDGSYAQKTYTFGVIQITTNQLPPYSVGVPYSFQLQASGGSGNYAWKIISGNLPTGLSLSVNGVISGTPT